MVSRRYIPTIVGDAFRSRTSIEIVPPGEMGCNDHCLFQDAGERWHCIGIINADVTNGESFFHAYGESPIEPMKVLDPIYEVHEGERTAWAPCNVVVEDTIHFFWTDAIEFFGIPQSDDERGIFRQHHATAPHSDVRNWTLHGIVFQEEGGVRDPEVVRVGDRWMMIYCRRVDFGGRFGESVVSYRFSEDLFHWSERAGDLVTGLEDTQWFGSSESPFLYQREEGWYLFVTHVAPENYHRTKVWFSENPTSFGRDEDHITVLFTHAAQLFEFEGKTWITNTGCHAKHYGFDFPSDIGVEVAELVWDPD
jgi:arabinan endo-1,5-alpha-L-arabinosidase